MTETQQHLNLRRTVTLVSSVFCCATVNSMAVVSNFIARNVPKLLCQNMHVGIVSKQNSIFSNKPTGDDWQVMLKHYTSVPSSPKCCGVDRCKVDFTETNCGAALSRANARRCLGGSSFLSSLSQWSVERLSFDSPNTVSLTI